MKKRTMPRQIAAAVIWGSVITQGFAITGPAEAAAKKKTAETSAATAAATLPAAKRVIEIQDIEPVRIDMPDDQKHDFGPDLQAILTRKLMESGKYIVTSTDASIAAARKLLRQEKPGDVQWPGSSLPAAKLRIRVQALSFQSGARGNRMFYGFNERMRNWPNEFPLREESSPSWFGGSFVSKGFAPFDSLSGLDLGEGLGINLLFAWLNVKYASYQSRLQLKLEIDAPLAGRNESRLIDVEGKGFFSDVVAGYDGLVVGVRLARRDAMDQAMKKAFDSAYAAVDRAVANLPLTARVDALLADGTTLLGTGPEANVPVGTLYRVTGQNGLVLEVISSHSSGSIGRVVRGDSSQIQLGAELVQIPSLNDADLLARAAKLTLVPSEPVLSAHEAIQLPEDVLKGPDLGAKIRLISQLQAFARSLLETALLPYRVWRYFQYDLPYRKTAQTPTPDNDLAGEVNRVEAEDIRNSPIVAIIDSGVDYNHPAIHDSLWINPSPQRDSYGQVDRYGWDFISGDSRPFDDHFHGTRLASAVLAAAPQTRIMPLKVFNPWGVTNSAALYNAFVYAVDHGATVILCGWSTFLRSDALEAGIAYAAAQGIPVVTLAQGGYPAAFARSYSNLILASALAHTGGLFAEGNGTIQKLNVAEPRGSWEKTEINIDLIAAQTAGRLAQEIGSIR